MTTLAEAFEDGWSSIEDHPLYYEFDPKAFQIREDDEDILTIQFSDGSRWSQSAATAFITITGAGGEILRTVDQECDFLAAKELLELARPSDYGPFTEEYERDIAWARKVLRHTTVR